jgi:hypothetical protein
MPHGDNLAMLARNDLAEYIADHYGRCRLAPSTTLREDLRAQGCRCLDAKIWAGRACPNWEPVSARNWDELGEVLRRVYLQSRDEKRPRKDGGNYDRT